MRGNNLLQSRHVGLWITAFQQREALGGHAQLITDGNANVSMGDMDPSKEAILVAEMIRVKKIRSIVLGTGGQGWHMPDGNLFAPAQELAVAMGGEFYPMDEITTKAILQIIGSQHGFRD